jgi:hypothetical protein
VPPITISEDPFKYCPPIYAWVFQVTSCTYNLKKDPMRQEYFTLFGSIFLTLLPVDGIVKFSELIFHLIELSTSSVARYNGLYCR